MVRAMGYDYREAHGYGRLADAMRATLAPFIAGQTVYDLGAGALLLSRELVALGAARVVAIDRATPSDAVLSQARGVEFRCRRFAEVDILPTDIAFVSWPENTDPAGLVELLRPVRTVVYLGKNTDGTACGGTHFWRQMLSRPVLACERSRPNDLVVYGPVGEVARPLVPEEVGALAPEPVWWTDAP